MKKHHSKLSILLLTVQSFMLSDETTFDVFRNFDGGPHRLQQPDP